VWSLASFIKRARQKTLCLGRTFGNLRLHKSSVTKLKKSSFRTKKQRFQNVNIKMSQIYEFKGGGRIWIQSYDQSYLGTTPKLYSTTNILGTFFIFEIKYFLLLEKNAAKQAL
jgi:hypothetical protein